MHPSAGWLAPDGMHPGRATTALTALRSWRAVTGRGAAGTPLVSGPLYARAPSESGFFNVDRHARARPSLVPEAMVRALAGQP